MALLAPQAATEASSGKESRLKNNFLVTNNHNKKRHGMWRFFDIGDALLEFLAFDAFAIGIQFHYFVTQLFYTI